MAAKTAPLTLPFELGEPRSFRGLTLVPLFSSAQPELDYIGLDEAVASGLTISEIGAEGIVELLALENALDSPVLLYEGEELAGAKQNRVVDQSILVGAQTTLTIPAKCVERGRWSHRTESFAAAPRAAYPALRRAQRESQHAVWTELSAKAERLAASSPTEAAEAIYVSRRASLDEYVQALPRLDGQSGVLVSIGGRIACLDYVSRSDVFAGIYLKLLRGYALEAIETPVDRQLSKAATGRFLGELELAQLSSKPPIGAAETWAFEGYVSGRQLVLDSESLALTAFPGR